MNESNLNEKKKVKKESAKKRKSKSETKKTNPGTIAKFVREAFENNPQSIIVSALRNLSSISCCPFKK